MFSILFPKSRTEMTGTWTQPGRKTETFIAKGKLFYKTQYFLRW